MFVKVLRAASDFFDRNSLGRILTRFSLDLEAVDEQLPSVILGIISVI